MNINPTAKRILCFGDSNTWGANPTDGTRWSGRWPLLLQKSLGTDCEIIEEGLCGRTTNLDDPGRIGKNGLTYLLPCLDTHNPLDLVILMLGTNDLKERYGRTPLQVAEALESLISAINKHSKKESLKLPKILILCPPVIDESVKGVEEKYKGAEAKSKMLPELFKKVAEDNNLYFLNLQDHIKSSKIDGYHLDFESHKKISDLLVSEILKIFN